MKRLTQILTVITIVLTLAWGAMAGEQFATCSGEQTADKVIYAKPCAITAIHLITDSTNDALLVIHDNATAASGTVRFERTQEASNTHGGSIIWCVPKEMYNGIFATVTGTDASYIIEYIKR